MPVFVSICSFREGWSNSVFYTIIAIVESGKNFIILMAGKQVVDFVLIETSLSRLKIGEVKDPTSLEEVTSVPKDKQQTEEQSGEDESESFEETLGENQGNLTSFNITIKFERRQYKIFFFFKKTNRKTCLICKAMDSYYKRDVRGCRG